MGTVARLLRFCGFLREPEGVEGAREAIWGYLKHVPEDSVASDIYWRLTSGGSPDDSEDDGGAVGGGEPRDENVRGVAWKVKKGTALVDSPVPSRSVSRAEAVGYGGRIQSDFSPWDLYSPNLNDHESPEGGVLMAPLGYGLDGASRSASGGDALGRLLPPPSF